MDNFNSSPNVAWRSILAGMPSTNLNHDMSTIEASSREPRHGNGFKDRAGKKNGRLTFLRLCGKKTFPNGHSFVQWLCKCDCGNHKIVPVNRLSIVKSCGCLRKDHARKMMITMHHKHGEASNGNNSIEYSTWRSMLGRCRNPNDKGYAHYGGRGITVCDDWNEYVNFLRDMGRKPRGFSLERKDNNKGYSRENCKWATPMQQGRNKRNNIILTVNGKSKVLTEWADEMRICSGTIRARIQRGWSHEDAVLTKV